MLSPTVMIGLRQHTGSNWRGLERGYLCDVSIRDCGKRPAGLCKSLRTLPLWYLREGDTKGPELAAKLCKASERINFGIAQFEVEVFSKRRKNEREQG